MENDESGLIYHITDWQLDQWANYYDLEPFGEERADLRSALTTSAVINSVRGLMAGWSGKTSYETVNPYDLLLFKDEDRIAARLERKRLSTRTQSDIDAENESYFQSFKQTMILSGRKGIEIPETCILIKSSGEVIKPGETSN